MRFRTGEYLGMRHTMLCMMIHLCVNTIRTYISLDDISVGVCSGDDPGRMCEIHIDTVLHCVLPIWLERYIGTKVIR